MKPLRDLALVVGFAVLVFMTSFIVFGILDYVRELVIEYFRR